MEQLLSYVRRHWQAWLVLGLAGWRMSRSDSDPDRLKWIAVGLAALGMAMNLTVILVNRGMPVQVPPEGISDEERPHYHSLTPATRLAWLSDWIPAGNLLMSPGDVVLLIGAGMLCWGMF